MKRTKSGVARFVATVVSVTGLMACATEPSEDPKLKVKVGADVRIRYDVTQGLPNDKHGESRHSDYMRFRVRPWLQTDYDNSRLYLRLADEFRYYRRPETNSRKQQFPDVVFIDSLYFEQKGLFDAIDIKIGRQDMAFGSRRIIADGTGGDGSRSAYFDALRMTLHADEERSLDAFAVYCAADDWMPTLGKEHENGKKAHKYDMSGYKQDELGLGLYWQDRGNKDLGYDLYYVAKEEIRGYKAKYRSEGSRDWTHTAGFRLLLQFTETLRGELECALQAGDNSRVAELLYGGLTYAPKCTWKPYLTGAMLYLSGDSAGARGENAWHAVFNRETGIGEAVAPMYTKYNYTNLIYPHLKSGMKYDAHTFDVEAGPMFTATREERADGGDYSAYRGLYARAKYSLSLGKVFGDWANGGKLSLQGEWLQKGDYFNDRDDNAALFARAEISWSF